MENLDGKLYLCNKKGPHEGIVFKLVKLKDGYFIIDYNLPADRLISAKIGLTKEEAIPTFIKDFELKEVIE